MDEKALTELLECSVCLEQLDETSKVLPCQHTFCRRCLDEIVNSKRELRCPECRAVVETRVDNLPSNILLIRLLESMKNVATSQVGEQCSGQKKYSAFSNHNSPKTSYNKKQSSPPLNTPQPCGRALYNYEAKEPGDLSFKKGDQILLKKQVDENWYHGELHGQHGFFPASYIQVITPLPQEIPICKALYDFVINDQNEKDCLTFHKDEVITVIRRVDDNWAEGKLGERIGIFPISFVEMNDAAKWLINTQNKSSDPTSPGLSGTVELDSLGSHQGITPFTTAALILQHPSLALLKPTSHKRHSLTAITMGSSKISPPRHHAQQRHSMEVPSNININAMATTSISLPVCTVASMNASLQATQQAVTEPSKMGQAWLSTAPAMIYVALYNYKPQKDDEIELVKGECYTVTEKCQDGWFKGTQLRTGKNGVFPGNYVRLVKSSATKHAGITGLKMGYLNSSVSHPEHTKAHNRHIPKTSSKTEDHARSRSKSNSQRHGSSGSQSSRSPNGQSGGNPTQDNPSSNSESTSAENSPPANVDDNGNFTQGSPSSGDPTSSKSDAQKSSTKSDAPSDDSHNATLIGQGATNGTELPTYRTVPKSESHPKISTKSHSVEGVQKSPDVPVIMSASAHSAISATKRDQSGTGLTVMVPQRKSHSRSSTANKQASSQVHGDSSNTGSQERAEGPSPPVPKRQPRCRSSSHHAKPRQPPPPTPPLPGDVQHSSAPSTNITPPPNVVVGAEGGATVPDQLPTPVHTKKEKKEKERLSAALRRFTKSGKKSKTPAQEPTEATQSTADVKVDHQRSISLPLEDGQGSIELVHHRKINSTDQGAVPHRPTKPKPLVREKFRCVVPYPPQSEIELELKVGDIVYVHRKREDGWFKGTLHRTGKTGLFPGSFVESC